MKNEQEILEIVKQEVRWNDIKIKKVSYGYEVRGTIKRIISTSQSELKLIGIRTGMNTGTLFVHLNGKVSLCLHTIDMQEE